jgi:hypothetical protein
MFIVQMCWDTVSFHFFDARHRCFSGRCLFATWFHDCFSCLIQICKVEVLQLQLDILWLFTGLFFFNFASCWNSFHFSGLTYCHLLLTGKFPCCCFSMVGVPASKFCCRSSLSVLLIYVSGNHASSYAECNVHSYLQNCNAKGFSKSSWKLLWVGCRCRE